MNVTERIRAAPARLSPGERRVADVVASDPEAVAFGTVASVAARAGTSGPTVLRLATRLGFAGFVALQAAVRDGLSQRLRPAVERIRGAASGPVLVRALEVELANVRRTLDAVDARAFAAAVALLGDPRRQVFVLPSEQCRPCGSSFAVELGLLRDGVRLVGGSEFRVVSQLARVKRGDAVVVVDLQRHERWLVDAARRASACGARRIVLADGPLSTLVEDAQHVFSVAADAAGPFDSQVGILALLNALVAGVADALRPQAARRIERLEQTWVESGALLD
ncbi:MurR/RpiR family transcriptional regulator [Candidatus Binatia bacterium]|nr:MurR/RpiR family transcriptional regulator [Candidatus Binatia bacterium]